MYIRQRDWVREVCDKLMTAGLNEEQPNVGYLHVLTSYIRFN